MGVTESTRGSNTGLEELSNEEFLERVAALDPNEYPIAEHAQRALEERDQA
jgi:hypothetical protein